MNNTTPRKPTQQQFVLPLLDALENEGGKASTGDLYDSVARKMGVADDHRNEQIVIGGKRFNAFERTVRWGQQRAKALGLVVPTGKSTWQLTGKGKDALHTAAPGIVITIFTTADGIAMYGRAEEAIAHVEDDSVSLIFSSPPYPLLRRSNTAIWVPSSTWTGFCE
ncbi:winged helix-turn-helix domain-containing protein [Burkholderia sp. Ac-20365]|uniref:winged helix-turn-helix domain-containing protein n=1 Tax=Burkholderia sp. Ac-20365 TaxID=2703897 RepID=UPI001F11956B|nr:winged helix-turn-helix domain-containing protein [Burkholderia sp. Ac-20365]